MSKHTKDNSNIRENLFPPFIYFLVIFPLINREIELIDCVYISSLWRQPNFIKPI